MGYACPVCDAEQADAVHLANHLAVTASLGRSDHEAWLETHAPEWADHGPEELAAVVREHAPEIETTGPTTAEGASPSLEAELARQSRGAGRESMTAETARVLEEAQELTRRMHAGEEGDDDRDSATDNENA
ncbi:DUF5810 domain-containing protein [Natrononativus amylolyticus]|uniref:DUF5810 domain-containing protein n=1 Tax=Natrononativus amylolyticus TaxID=2963434 RepID=UPI0020CED445|nr:DUF5810 domain-containing protein [Natrononativus amylolyticus]